MKIGRISLYVCALFVAGCSPSVFDGAATGYDAQACVEDALLKRTDPQLVKRAATTFSAACAKEDAAACSALGLLVEQGKATSQNQPRELYQRACVGENLRGCTHLARLDLSVNPASAKRRLIELCNQSEPLACSVLGRSLTHGEGLSQAKNEGRFYLDQACEAGRADACFELASAELADNVKPTGKTLELLVRSCVAGHKPACDRMASRPRVASR